MENHKIPPIYVSGDCAAPDIRQRVLPALQVLTCRLRRPPTQSSYSIGKIASQCQPPVCAV